MPSYQTLPPLYLYCIMCMKSYTVFWLISFYCFYASKFALNRVRNVVQRKTEFRLGRSGTEFSPYAPRTPAILHNNLRHSANSCQLSYWHFSLRTPAILHNNLRHSENSCQLSYWHFSLRTPAILHNNLRHSANSCQLSYWHFSLRTPAILHNNLRHSANSCQLSYWHFSLRTLRWQITIYLVRNLTWYLVWKVLFLFTNWCTSLKNSFKIYIEIDMAAATSPYTDVF
jgi:hypothetical protein